MRRTHLDGVVFSQAEMLALMNAVQPQDLIAIDSNALIPADTNTHRALIREGLQQLIERGLVTVEGDVYVLNPELLLIARIVAFPQIVTMLLKDVPERGLQKFVYYQASQFIVEHTMPADQQYRFATLPNVTAQMERMAFVLPASQKTDQPSFDFEMPQECFFRVRELILTDSFANADLYLKTLDLPPHAMDTLLSAMADPLFSGTIAFLAVEPPQIMDTRNLMVLQGQDSAWTILAQGSGALRLRTVAADTLLQHFFESWQEVAYQIS